MRADIHDGPEHMLQSEAGYIDARPLNASSTKPLATHGRTIHLGHFGRFWHIRHMSGLGTIPEMLARCRTRHLRRGSNSQTGMDNAINKRDRARAAALRRLR